MTKLVPLKLIPTSARKVESFARAQLGADALEVSRYRIETAPGCHSRPYFDPPVFGWVVTREAADALAAQQTRMPDHTAHARMVYSVY